MFNGRQQTKQDEIDELFRDFRKWMRTIDNKRVPEFQKMEQEFYSFVDQAEEFQKRFKELGLITRKIDGIHNYMKNGGYAIHDACRYLETAMIAYDW